MTHPWTRPDLPTVLVLEDDDNPDHIFVLPPRVFMLGGHPRIMLDHEIFVKMIPSFDTRTAVQRYENGCDQCRR